MTQTKKTKPCLWVLFDTHSSDEYNNGDADWAILEIDLELAKTIRERMGLIQDIQKRDGRAYRLSYFDYNVQYFTDCDVLGGLLDINGEKVDGDGPPSILAAQPPIPEEEFVRMECQTMHVGTGDVGWDAIVKHTSITVEAFEIGTEMLEDIIQRLEAMQ